MKKLFLILVIFLISSCYRRIYDPCTGKKVKPKMEKVRSKVPMTKLGG